MTPRCAAEPEVIVVGAGLAGCEAAWQAAQRGAAVTLYEMRPLRMTPAHTTALLAELVCSNSFGSDLPDRALGMLKHELRSMGSLIIACADETSLPAGAALAVARDAFSRAVTRHIEDHPCVRIRREEVISLPSGAATVIATGPLTSDALAAKLSELAGEAHLQFFDAVAPIVSAESIDMGIAFRGNRYGRSTATGASAAYPGEDAGDYINCPLGRDEYYAFVEAITSADQNPARDFEATEGAEQYFEACLPIEVLAARHPDALAFGPMRPVGLRDPRTGRRPFAVVQLRQDNAAGTLYNLVGFQTNIRHREQERVLRMIPGLQDAEFVRLGQMHRNTFINSPHLLRPTLQWHDMDDLLFAGQIVGTEGYVGAAAGGLLAGVNAYRIACGQIPVTLPVTTMMGALFNYITRTMPGQFQPMKANFGLLPDLMTPLRDKRQRHEAYVARGRSDLQAFLSASGLSGGIVEAGQGLRASNIDHCIYGCSVL